MSTVKESTVEERILQLLRHLNIEKAHFAACETLDYRGLVANHPEVIASLTLACPLTVDSEVLGPISDKLMVITGDHGQIPESLSNAIDNLQGVEFFALSQFLGLTWDDPIRVRRLKRHVVLG